MSIVVAFTPSGQGHAALTAAVKEAQRTRESLIVAAHRYALPDSDPEAVSEEAIAARIAASGADSIDWTTVIDSESDAGDFLLQVVEKEHARLLVIGLRRKSRIGKLNLGSTARRVLVEAPCPVLTVKEDSAPQSWS